MSDEEDKQILTSNASFTLLQRPRVSAVYGGVFEIRCVYEIPNTCSICENTFVPATAYARNGAAAAFASKERVGDEEGRTAATASVVTVKETSDDAVRPFDAMHEICDGDQHVSLTIFDANDDEQTLISKLLTLRQAQNPKNKRFCVDCFEKTILYQIEQNTTRAFHAEPAVDDDGDKFTIYLYCPFCSVQNGVAVSQQGAPQRKILYTDKLLAYLSPPVRKQVQEALDAQYLARNTAKIHCPVEKCLFSQVLLYFGGDARLGNSHESDDGDSRENSSESSDIDNESEGSDSSTGDGSSRERRSDNSNDSSKDNGKNQEKQAKEQERLPLDRVAKTITCPDHGTHCYLCWEKIDATTQTHRCRNFPAAMCEGDAGRNTRRCPSCFQAIYRVDGCNSMVCAHCRHSFDWQNAMHLIVDQDSRNKELQIDEYYDIRQRYRISTEEERRRFENDEARRRFENDEAANELHWNDDFSCVGTWAIDYLGTTTHTYITFYGNGTFYQDFGNYAGRWFLEDRFFL